MPCTTILVGKKASYDGSTLMARNEDSGAGRYMPKKFVVVQPEDQPRKYRSVISKVEIDLPDNPMRYTSMPNALPDRGLWAEAGFNTCNVAMSATETISNNPRVRGADPLVAGGIGEEDMLTIVLPYIHSAREGVQRMGQLLEQYGTYEINGIGFQDVDEIWWMETIGGHHWMAKRVPDDAYVIAPNIQTIDWFDFEDAFGAQKDHICSADLKEFVSENFLDINPTGDDRHFDARSAFGVCIDCDYSYNTPRAWYGESYFNPGYVKAQGFTPESTDMPWSLVPEKKVTIEDIKYVLSSYYQRTPYNPYLNYGDTSLCGKYRTIGINRTNFMGITQLRPYRPEAIRAVEWICEGSNAFNGIVPFYANINDTPAYLRDADKTPTTENFYWVNRIIGALADAHFAETAASVEEYQTNLFNGGHEMLNRFDREFMNRPPEDICAYLQNCNQQIADWCREQTYDVLDKVLYSASNCMKNSYARSDV